MRQFLFCYPVLVFLDFSGPVLMFWQDASLGSLPWGFPESYGGNLHSKVDYVVKWNSNVKASHEMNSVHLLKHLLFLN